MTDISAKQEELLRDNRRLLIPDEMCVLLQVKTSWL